MRRAEYQKFAQAKRWNGLVLEINSLRDVGVDKYNESLCSPLSKYIIKVYQSNLENKLHVVEFSL